MASRSLPAPSRPDRARRALARLLAHGAAATACALAGWPLPAAAQSGTPGEAVAMARAAVAHIGRVGAAQAYQDFGADLAWRRKDLYVFVMDFQTRCLAHGVNRKMVGRQLGELIDEAGRSPAQDMVERARADGAGWVRYRWVHPQTRVIQDKHTYVLRIPQQEALVGVGVYGGD